MVDPNVREFLGRNLDGPQELRVVLDTLSHEVEHIRESPLEAKREMMEEYEDTAPKLAGDVYNVVEDAYIDHKRTRRLPGLRTTRAFVVDALMSNHHRRPRIDNMDSKPKAVFEGLLQMSVADYAKGLGECDDDVQKLVTWGRKRLQDARATDDADARIDIAREIVDTMIDTFGADDARDAMDDLDMPPGAEPDPPNAPDPPDDSMDPDDAPDPIDDGPNPDGDPDPDDGEPDNGDGEPDDDDGEPDDGDGDAPDDDPTGAGGDGSGGQGGGDGDSMLGEHDGHNVVLKP